MTDRRDPIDHFIHRLSCAETAPDACNQYAPGSPTNAIRRANLRRYLQAMVERRPDTLLVMEAPGYRGCRLTGVPVTSRRILLEGVPDLELFGSERGFQDVPEPGFERVQGEQSATIVWGTLRQIGVVPLIWNTFPFHPHQPGQPLTNRRPRAPETALGTTFLRDLLDWFAPSRVIAVGNVAYATLESMAVMCERVRHPAQGGKNDFVAGLTAHLQAQNHPD
ncbi:MAG TPA: uracil-DNA glycosylase [Spirillospora sp.]|nr:uracil-DNA glycosylase [Spirillospora sp.]